MRIRFRADRPTATAFARETWPGLVDKEIVEAARQLRAAEHPGGAADEDGVPAEQACHVLGFDGGDDALIHQRVVVAVLVGTLYSAAERPAG